MINIIKKYIKEAFQHFGFDIKIRRISPTNTDKLFLRNLLNKYNIDLVIDVGANEGQFLDSLLETNYNNSVISIEPIKSMYDKLYNKFKDNPKITTINCAIGNENIKTKINISENYVSSSLLEITDKCTSITKETAYITTEDCDLKKLDLFYDKFKNNRNILLKIDVQGYEHQVLLGAIQTLNLVKVISVEMSLVELYKGQKLFMDIVSFLNTLGFQLYSIVPAFVDESSGQMLQVDGVFVRK